MTAIFAISALAGQAQEKQFSIIPEPAEITVAGEGTVQIERGMLVRVSDSSLVASADFLADYTNRYLGIPLRVDVPKKGKKRTADKAVNGIVLVNRNNGEVSGGYRLEVIPGTGVRIEGNDAAGVFYGVQTLIQMLPVRAGVLPILARPRSWLSPFRLSGDASGCGTPFLSGRVYQEVYRLSCFAQTELFSLASYGRPGLACRDEVPA